MGCGSSSSADTTGSSHNRPSHRDDNDNRRDRRDSEPSGDSEDDFVKEALNAHNDFRYCMTVLPVLRLDAVYSWFIDFTASQTRRHMIKCNTTLIQRQSWRVCTYNSR